MLVPRLVLVPALLFAQEAPVFHSDTTIVTVPCVVTDASGVTVKDLRPDDFRLFVDDSPRKIDNLWVEADLPLILGVINDVSGSQQDRIREHETAITQFLGHMIRPNDRAFVVAVAANVLLNTEVRGGPHGLLFGLLPPGGQPLGVQCGTLAGKRPICGGTALWNAVYAAAHLKLNSPSANKALIVLSDGNDTGSTHTLDAALEEVQHSGLVVYAIRYRDSLNEPSIPTGLVRLTKETGGVLFDPPGTDYSEVLSRIEADIRSRYVLGFRPGASATTAPRHSIRVETVRSGTSVRARDSYLTSP